MDPTTVWQNLLTDMKALQRGDEELREDVVEHLRNLAAWLDKGGFPPEA